MSKKPPEETLALPAISEQFSFQLLSPMAVEEVDGLTNQARVIAQDALIVNNILRCLVGALPHAYDASELCALSRTTLTVLETRRRLLLLPTRAPSERNRSFEEDEYLIPFG